VSTAERRAIINTRIASTLPSLLLAEPVAVPDRAARAAATASTGSDLPLSMPGLTVGSINLYDTDTGPGQVAGEADTVGAGALHTHQGELTL